MSSPADPSTLQGSPIARSGAHATEVNRLKPRRAAAAAVIANGRAARYHPRDGGAIEVWDLHKKAVAATLPLPEPELGLAAQGDAIVIVARGATGAVRVLRLAPGATAPTVLGGDPIAARPQRVIATARELFVAERGGLSRFTLGPALALAGHTPWSADQVEVCTGLGDSVVFAEAGALVRIGPGDRRAAYATPLTGLLHLAPGPDADRLWATTAGALHLLSLAGAEAKHVREVPLPGIYHLASAGDAAAVLSVEMKAGAWARLTLTAIGPDGAVRWRKDLPVPKRLDASVAGGDGYVAVVADGQLTVLSSKDGAAVVP